MGSGYFRMSGDGCTDQAKGFALGAGGLGQCGTVAVMPAKRTWLRVRVAKWPSRPRKLQQRYW